MNKEVMKQLKQRMIEFADLHKVPVEIVKYDVESQLENGRVILYMHLYVDAKAFSKNQVIELQTTKMSQLKNRG